VSGIKFLLDTNVIIGLLKNTPAALELVQENGLRPRFAAISQITKIELLGYQGITPDEEKAIQAFLGSVTVFGIDSAIEAKTIELRKSRKVKLPDALVAATALANGLQLLTLDKTLLKAFDSVSKAST
jgi:predicted nucleic acid-binding protein